MCERQASIVRVCVMCAFYAVNSVPISSSNNSVEKNIEKKNWSRVWNGQLVRQMFEPIKSQLTDKNKVGVSPEGMRTTRVLYMLACVYR